MAPSDHNCKAEDLSLELFRCSSANQRGETRRQDTEGHASEIKDNDENPDPNKTAETPRRFGECPFLNIFKDSSCSSHLSVFVVYEAIGWMLFRHPASLNNESTCKEHSSVHDGYLVHKKDKL